MLKFKAVIHKYDSNGEKTGWSYLEIPAKIAEKICPGNKRSFRVKGTIDKTQVEALALVPIGGGDFILPLKKELRKVLKKEKGATVIASLEKDDNPDPFPPPADFKECLEDEPEAKRTFYELPRSHQHYFIKWIESAKTDPTRIKRISIAVNALSHGMLYPEMLRAEKKKTTNIVDIIDNDMKKTIILTLIVTVALAITTTAQFTNGNVGARHFQGAEKIKGRVMERGNMPAEEATGSPFLNPDWGSGVITYKDGRVFNNVEMQYNLMNNELYFKKAEEIFMFTDTVNSFQVTYSVNDDVKVEKFQAGYPGVDKFDANQFYQVFAEGPKVHFLLNKNVKRLESYHYSEGKKINYFLTEEYYLFDAAAGTMKKIKKGEDAVIEALPAYTDQIKTIVKAQKLKLKNTEDIVKLVAELNKQ